MNLEFSKIYELCNWVLRTAAMHPGAVQNSLIKSCLSTLAAFLDWVPPVHIFSGDLVTFLLESYLDNQLFRTATLECLTEVAGVTMEINPNDPSFALYQTAVINLLSLSMNKLSQSFPPKTTSFATIFMETDPNMQLHMKVFAQKLSLFLLAFAQNHLTLCESSALQSQGTETESVIIISLDALLSYMVSLTEFPDDEVFKICCEFWHTVSKHLYEQRVAGWLENKIWSMAYRANLSKARMLLIPRTAKPTEVLISVDEQGNVVREKLQDTENIALYDLMRETLVYLTHLDPEDTEHIIMLKMAKQMDGSEWSWTRISSLAYAIGSISGSMDEEHEKRFLIHVIKDLLALCEGKRGKENKAIVATNIMYVVMQYPRFLSNHWNFLKTVVKKLFEFMHELHPGIQDMSVDTFLRIAQNCGADFVVPHDIQDQREPFIYEVIRIMAATISELQNHQKLVYYQAIGHILSNIKSYEEMDYHLTGALALVQSQWTQLLSLISQNLAVIQDPEVTRSLAFCIKVNESLSQSLGHFYYIQLGKIYNDMIQLYTTTVQFLNSEVAAKGPIVVGHTHIVSARALCKRILNLISTYIKICQTPQLLIEHFIQPIFEIVVRDFVNSPIELRDAEVITLVADIINKLGREATGYMQVVLGVFLDSVLNMLVSDYTNYPEQRSSFFELLKAVASQCFESLLQLPIERFKVAIDTILWASKHQSTQHAELGLITLKQILQSLESSGVVANYFYQHFYVYVLTEIFAIMTDGLHIANFKHHSQILRYLFYIVDSGLITAPLTEGIAADANKAFVISHLTQILATNFTNMNRVQIETLILSMFNRCNDQVSFKNVLRDFLVTTKEIAVDNESFYAEEREKEIEEARRLIQEKKALVPGLLPQFTNERSS
mmetsp:Transcript_16544/g.16480  ORF Transcript_16544/g.16480 Transcript_16544/m.16480 type:complete len:894 (-) Transcript_16544:18-2699(-)